MDAAVGETIVRSFARLTILIATLMTSAIHAWGQAQPSAYADPSVPAAPSQLAAQPSPRPPVSTQGTWVSDDNNTTPPAGPQMMGNAGVIADPQMMGGPVMSSPQMMTADGQIASGECGPEGECADGGCAGGKCLFHDLWGDVHAHRRIWLQGDYLSFWAKGNALPPLVTSSPLGTPQSQAGVLPESATTSILFGNNSVDTERRNGARLNFGYWLVDGEFIGIEGHYFYLQQLNTTFQAASDFGTDPNAQILARPFFNVDPNLVTPAEDSALIAFPNLVIGNAIVDLNGAIDVRTTSQIQSAGALWRRLIWIDFTMQRRLDAVLGYRFLRIDDSVTINDTSNFEGGVFPLTVLTSQDVFSARNLFNGGEIGLKFYQYHGPLSLEVIAKSAFGNNHEQVYINGFNTITSGGVTTTNVGGLLAQPTNIGTYKRDVFAILPEGDVNLRWDVARNVRLTMGYTFLYINRVQRSGSAINRTLNPTQINGGALVGDPQPAFAFQNTTWWAHGATAGVEIRW